MRRDVQEIFRSTPHGKQVMMFSATLSKEIRPVCKKFMQDVNINVSILLLVLLPLVISLSFISIAELPQHKHHYTIKQKMKKLKNKVKYQNKLRIIEKQIPKANNSKSKYK